VAQDTKDNERLKKKKLALKLAGRKAVNESYLKYVEIVNTSVNKDADWKRGKHLVYICNQIQEFITKETGNAYDIMVLSIPPQHGKSLSVTETLPSWYLGKNPDKSVIVLAYGDDLAQRFGRRNKEKIETFGKIFFDISISKTKSANDDFEIEGRKGRMITRGIMAGVTGNPAHLLIIDDPVRTREEAYSAVTREKIWQEWISSVKTRLAGGAKVILIMTRWHEDDLAGQILKTEKNAVHINIPCEAEDNDVLGRKKGEGLFPEIGKGTAWKDQMKASYIAGEGLDAWNAMYQGRPSVQGGNIFKRDWFKFYTDLPTMYQTIISVDAAFKDTKTSDFVAIGVWGKSGANVYLLDLINERMDFVRTLEVIRLMKRKYAEANMVLIEDKANGSAIISTLRQEIMGVVPVEPLGSKESRAYAIQPFVMAGNVWLPKNAPWVEDYLDQMMRFPKSSKDDMVDMTTQALVRLKDFVAEGVAPPKPKPDFTILQQPKSIISQLTNIKVSKGFMNY
jgi:predicted phage terminase large subunit-like protein